MGMVLRAKIARRTFPAAPSGRVPREGHSGARLCPKKTGLSPFLGKAPAD